MWPMLLPVEYKKLFCRIPLGIGMSNCLTHPLPAFANDFMPRYDLFAFLHARHVPLTERN